MKAALAYWATLAAYYVASIVVAFVLVRWLAGGVVAVVLVVVQFVLMSAITLAAFMFEDDWWNDFEDQNRGIVLGVLGNAASVLVGVVLARVL